MSTSVIPRQQGDAYQGCYFWLEATKVLQPSTNAVLVEWESTSSVGFDDVVVHYKPAKLDHGDPITYERFQIKFHVDQSSGFTCQSLIDPGFIGTTADTILKRLQKHYVKGAEIYKASRFYFVSTWPCDLADPLKKLLGNGGALRFQVLFDGTTDASEMGQVRKSWREHLGITTDDELRQILQPLRIVHSYHDLDRIIQPLNQSLQLAGLKPFDPEHRTSGYLELIQRLHAEGRNRFTREELLEICRQEGLLASPAQPPPDLHIIGVRSFKKGAETLEAEVDDLLCLLHKFQGRFLLEDTSWAQVHREVVDLATRAVGARKPLRVHLDTHLSMAFCLGYCLDTKSGVHVSIVQKTFQGRVVWSPDPDTISPEHTAAWSWRRQVFKEDGKDIVLALNVTHDIADQVGSFVKDNLPDVGWILSGQFQPGPSTTVIKDANHIIRSVQEVIRHVRKELTSIPGVHRVHLFMAAPNAFAFFLGQQSIPLGQITLYEFDFEGFRTGGYQPSISLPIQ